MPRPAIAAATPIPAFAPALRELEGAGVWEGDDGVVDAEGGMVLLEDVEDVEGVEDVEDGEDGEDAEDETVLLVEEVAEADVVELDAACLVKDCGGGA